MSYNPIDILLTEEEPAGNESADRRKESLPDVSDESKRSVSSAVIMTIRKLILISALFGIPFLAIFWDHLPRSFSKIAVATGLQADKNHFVHYIDEELPDENLAVIPQESIANGPKNNGVGPATAETDLSTELARLGAIRCSLQPWGQSGSLWRFSCEVPPATGPQGFSQQFEAVDTDQTKAVQIVVSKIMTWQNETRLR